MRSMSLVERKKLQWAREREELARLGGYWKSNHNNQNFEKSYERSRYGGKPSSLTTGEPPETYQRQQRFIRDTKDYQYPERRGSLPPLYKNQYNSYNSIGYEKGGETSGYGSDNNNNIPEVGSQREMKQREIVDSVPQETNHWVVHQTQTIQNTQNAHSGYESSSSLRDDRPKWGDKGVGVGKFWQPKEEHFDKTPSNEPPNWVKRGLQDGLPDGTIVVANSSPSVSPEQRFEDTDRPYTGSSYSNNKKTYIRGQNLPIDEVELAERERKRQIAMVHQQAIRQQLEERERKKKEEREQKLREELEEELRLKKEREYEKQKKLEEEKLKLEKIENERKRKEAIKMAMELAEKEAKLEKIKQKMMKQSCDINIDKNNFDENIVEKEKVNDSVIESKTDSKKEDKNYQLLNNNNTVLNNTKTMTPTFKNNPNPIQNEIVKNVEPKSASKREVSPTKSALDKNSPRHEVVNQYRSLTPSLTPRNDNFAVVLHPSLDQLHQLNNFGQYAVLVPANSAPHIPIAIPIGFVAPPNTDRSLVSTARTENRMLTPTQYRNNVLKCDSSTQTDASLLTSARSSSETTSADCVEKYERRGKTTNLEIEYNNNKQKEQRSRSESTEERPKWGVNRPPTRYLKQSEKDPFYHRRKLRQKQRESNKSDSDDTTEPSVSYRSKKGFPEKRHSRAKWRTHGQDQMLTRNVKMYQREIIPLEANNDKIYYKNCCCSCRCQKHKCTEGVTRVDVLQIEENSPRETVQYQEVVQRHSVGEHKLDIMNKLTSLHSGLILEKERWEQSPRTPPDLIPLHDQ